MIYPFSVAQLSSAKKLNILSRPLVCIIADKNMLNNGNFIIVVEIFIRKRYNHSNKKMRIKSMLKTKNSEAKIIVFETVKVLLLSLILGLVGGAVGAVFSHSIALVTEIRGNYSFIICFLPLGGLITVLTYNLIKQQGINTDDVLKSADNGKKVSPLLCLAVFLSTCITHLFGGSAGREGAALQIGGSLASGAIKIFRVNDKNANILVQCGMAAMFSALFGTPLGACVFALEVIKIGKIKIISALPCLLSSFVAYWISGLLGTAREHFDLTSGLTITANDLLKIAVVAMLASVLSYAFCKLLHFTEHTAKSLLKNNYIRIFIGGVLIVILTYVIGSFDYNGGGTDVLNQIFTSGQYKNEAFLLKILFTVITVGFGYKGGEIVPSLFIGGTFGATLSGILGLPVAIGSAVGMASMLSGVTNCTIATVVICLEMFGTEYSLGFILASVMSFIFSGFIGLYDNGKKRFYIFSIASFKDKNE